MSTSTLLTSSCVAQPISVVPRRCRRISGSVCNPLYRTPTAFPVLVEKDWHSCSLGFLVRCPNFTPESFLAPHDHTGRGRADHARPSPLSLQNLCASQHHTKARSSPQRARYSLQFNTPSLRRTQHHLHSCFLSPFCNTIMPASNARGWSASFRCLAYDRFSASMELLGKPSNTAAQFLGTPLRARSWG